MLSTLDESKEVEVRWVDQQMICEFGRLNGRKKELEEDSAELDKRANDMSDAEEGVMLVDETREGATKLLIGESFVDVDSGAALEFIQKAVAEDKAAMAAMAAEVKRINERQAVLKKELYGRFGKNINLEE
jgi:prefoldin subunit 4